MMLSLNGRKRFIEALNGMATYKKPVLLDTSKTQPLIILVSGNGGNGKDTFINMVKDYIKDSYALSEQEIDKLICTYSTIDPCRYCVDELFEVGHTLQEDEREEEATKKPDNYRSLLHDIKIAWDKYYNGSVNYIKYELKKLMVSTDPLNSVLCYRPTAIFIHAREKENMDELEKMIYKMFQFDVIRLGILKKDEIKITNAGDRMSKDIDYDIVIHNDGTKEELNIAARKFAINLLCAYHHFLQVDNLPENTCQTKIRTAGKSDIVFVSTQVPSSNTYYFNSINDFSSNIPEDIKIGDMIYIKCDYALYLIQNIIEPNEENPNRCFTLSVTTNNTSLV